MARGHIKLVRVGRDPCGCETFKQVLGGVEVGGLMLNMCEPHQTEAYAIHTQAAEDKRRGEAERNDPSIPTRKNARLPRAGARIAEGDEPSGSETRSPPSPSSGNDTERSAEAEPAGTNEGDRE